MNRLNNKVAIITGAAQGMGESHARLFVAEGAKVVLTDLKEDEGRKIAEELGENAIFIKHDVTSLADWKRVAEEAEKHFGYINVLVNNAGIAGPAAEIDELTEEDYLKVVAINQNSVYYGMHTVVPYMDKIKGGAIVNVSSVCGMMAVYGAPSAVYVASKFAVRGMTKMAAFELGKKNIRVNSLHPGIIETPMSKEAIADPTEALSHIPLGRVGQPIDTSYVALFLASDESAFVTGMEHVVDGGQTIR